MVLYCYAAVLKPGTPGISTQLVFVYNALLITGLVLQLPVVLTAWLSPRIQRSSTWFPFLGSWIVSSLVYLLLVGQQTGPPPFFGLCVTQAALVYAVPVLCVGRSVTSFKVQ